MKYQELQNKLPQSKSLLLVDVREPGEYTDGLTDDSFINIPLKELIDKSSERNLPDDKEFILVCKSGIRSQRAAEALRANGYQAHSLEEGINNLENRYE